MKTPRLLLLYMIIGLWQSPAVFGQSDFFTGKQIKIVVGFSTGGIIDLWARLFALYLGKYIPGNPTLVVQNLPGGGSMIAANQMYNVVKPDGLTVAMLSSGLYFDQLLGAKEVKYDWAKFGWVGSPVKNFEVLTMRNDTPYKTIEDIQKAAQPPRAAPPAAAPQATTFQNFSTMRWAPSFI
ncbi:MAG: hypothetical protein ACXWWP_12165 [Candidatus Binatia bacterium]